MSLWLNKRAFTEQTDYLVAWVESSAPACMDRDQVVQHLRKLDDLYEGGGDFKAEIGGPDNS